MVDVINPEITSKSIAEREGEDAACYGEDTNLCPYKPGSKEYSDWHDGFDRIFTLLEMPAH